LSVHYASIVCILSQLSLVITLYFNVYGQQVLLYLITWVGTYTRLSIDRFLGCLQKASLIKATGDQLVHGI